jgi:hypothetical protein
MFYDENSKWNALLRQVPDSFLNEKVEKSCPTHYPPEIAAYELVPELLELGHAGRFLVFGYGRKWRAIGDSVESAVTQLREHFPYQLAHIRWVHVVPAFLGTSHALEYRRWERSARPRFDYVENYMSRRLSELWPSSSPEEFARTL